MSLVEGIGDEVIIFVSISSTVLLFFLSLLYYFSSETSTGQTRRNTVSAQVIRRTEELPASESQESVNEVEPEASPPGTSEEVETTPAPDNASQEQNSEEISSDTVQENDPAVLRQRRLDFFTRQDHPEGGSTRSSECIEELPLEDATEHSGNGETVRETSTTDSTIRVRLKYLNDTERLVEGQLDEYLGEFKRRHFSSDLENNRIVRLIFNGRLLRNDEATLESFGIGDCSVVHVQISANTNQHRPVPTETTGDLNLSSLMWPLFATMLGIMWVLHFQYRELFNTTSTVVLVGISGLFCLGLFGQHYPRSGRLPNPPPG